MNGDIHINTPQRVVCLLLKRLAVSQRLLFVLEERHQRMFGGLGPSPLLTPHATALQPKTVVPACTIVEHVPEEAATVAIVEQFEPDDLQGHYFFRNMIDEDRIFFQMIEDDLIGLEAENWEEGWCIEEDLWESIDRDELEREQEEREQEMMLQEDLRLLFWIGKVEEGEEEGEEEVVET